MSQDSTNTPTPKDELVKLLTQLIDVTLDEDAQSIAPEGTPAVADALIGAGWRPPADDTEPWRVEARIHERRATSLGYCEYVIETYPDGEDDTCSEHRERGTVFCVQHQPDDDTETEWRLVAGADCYEAADEDDARKEADRWPASPLPVVEAFNHPVYLVGSVLTRPDYRDIDLRLILSDKRVARLGDGVRALMNIALSDLIARAACLPAPVDFQIQSMSEANVPEHRGRNPLGIEVRR